jgi:hypothetical protein
MLHSRVQIHDWWVLHIIFFLEKKIKNYGHISTSINLIEDIMNISHVFYSN